MMPDRNTPDDETVKLLRSTVALMRFGSDAEVTSTLEVFVRQLDLAYGRREWQEACVVAGQLAALAFVLFERAFDNGGFEHVTADEAIARAKAKLRAGMS